MSDHCEVCNNFDPRDHDNTRQWVTGPSLTFLWIELTDVLRSKQEGCRFCSLLTDFVQNFVPEWQVSMTKLSIYMVLVKDRPIELRIHENIGDEEEPKELADLYVYFPEVTPTTSSCLPTVGKGRPLAEHSADDQCFQFVEERLHNCTQQHSACIRQHRTRLPKRIVDIGDSIDELMLRETDGDEGLYVALSYSWGPSQHLLKTTSASLDQFKQNVPWLLLPKTLQDAVEITRRLSLRYIWIDSLCIIQDSQSDWEMESAKMCDYYENSHVTIAASACLSAQSSILAKRTAVSSPKKFYFSGTSGQSCTVFVQKRHRMQFPQVIHNLGPLSERGWTFQENALSGRVIHFTDSELIWECHTEMISEDGCPIRNNCSGLAHYFLSRLESEPESCWRFLVQSFSERKLSFQSDRLPAIAGIASKLQRLTSFEYRAGLWGETLILDLLWTSWGWTDPLKPPALVTGPSWSWASINSGVSFASESWTKPALFTPHIVIEDVQCKIPGLNPFGQATDGILQLTGPLIQMALEADDPTEFLSYSVSLEGYPKLQVFPDSFLEETELQTSAGCSELTVRRCTAAPKALRASVSCLWVCSNDVTPTPRVCGLVLAQSLTRLGAYTRLGVVDAEDVGLLGASTRRHVVIT